MGWNDGFDTRFDTVRLCCRICGVSRFSRVSRFCSFCTVCVNGFRFSSVFRSFLGRVNAAIIIIRLASDCGWFAFPRCFLLILSLRPHATAHEVTPHATAQQKDPLPMGSWEFQWGQKQIWHACLRAYSCILASVLARARKEFETQI